MEDVIPNRLNNLMDRLCEMLTRGYDRIVHSLDYLIGLSRGAIIGLNFIFHILMRFVFSPFDRFWQVKPRTDAPKTVKSLNFGRHSYVHTKDVKLHYVESGDRSKPLMVMLHGFPEFWYSWRHQIKEFSKDFWVVAVDMRGYGDSDKPAGRSKYKINILVEDVLNLIAELGRDKCTLVAHDWGGIIAWHLLLQHPSKVDSYVIMNSAHPIALRNVLGKKQSQRDKSWYVYFFQLPFLPELMLRMEDLNFLDRTFKSKKSPAPITEEDIEAYKYTFNKPGAFTGPINYYRANFMLGTRNQLRDLGRRPDVPPGLILYGDGDKYLDQEVQKESAKLVKNSTLIVIKGASHFVQQDDPESVNQEMRLFFDSLASDRRRAIAKTPTAAEND